MAKYSQKVLVVEDDKVMQKALVDNLREAGFEQVFEAKDGEEGLGLAMTHQPDLILLDILMPKMDGTAMLKKLRESDHGKKIKIIFLTNLAADESVMKSVVENEPAYYILKANSSIDEVIQKVKITLGLEQVNE